MKPLHIYFLGTGAWFLSWGIQSVVFAWLVTMVLNESPNLVGIAQMALLLPTMLFMLIGGSLADHFGGRRIALLGHLGAAIAPLFLTLVALFGELTYGSILVFAIIVGCAQAMVTPARDGLLALVADGLIQRRVVQVSMIQFGVQMIGFLVASFADQLGAAVILSMQFCVLIVGAFAYLKLKVPYLAPESSTLSMTTQITRSIVEGFHTVRASPFMRAVVLQNCAMGMFFMGSYIVTIPLVIRDVYGGSSVELSFVNAANSMGLVITIMVLLRFGDIHRQGRALLLAQGLGACALACAGLGLGFPSMIGFLFCWGMCGGIAMTMSRTIMQEQAPANQRARMMAFFSFSFMGSGPLGALLSGFLCEWVNPSNALIISSVAMLIVVILVGFTSSLWQLDATPRDDAN